MGVLIAVSQSDASGLLKRLKDIGYEDSSIVALVKDFEKQSLVLR